MFFPSIDCLEEETHEEEAEHGGTHLSLILATEEAKAGGCL